MLAYIKNVKIRTIGNLLAGLLVLVSAVVASMTSIEHREVEKIEAVWDEAFTQPSLKSVFLIEIRASLGYGGLIHNFKNFVLREDKRLAISFYAKLLQITFSLDALEALNPNELERAAIIQLRDIVEQYAAMAKVAEKMMATGATAREIDSAIRIDDSLAIEAITVLNNELARLYRASSENVRQSIDGAKQSTILTASIVTTLLLGLCIIVLWTFRVRIFRPLDTLRKTMHRLAMGDIGIEVPGREKTDELGDMAKALEVFRRNTAEIDDLRKTQALAESRAQEAELQAAEQKHKRIVAQERARRETEEVRRAELTVEVERQTAELRRSAARTRAITDSMQDALIIADNDGIILDFSKAAEIVFGYKASEAIGENVKILMPDSIAARHDDIIASRDRSGSSVSVCADRKLNGKRKNGEIFPLSMGLTELEYDGEAILIAVARDITEEVRNEEKMKRLGRFINWSKREVYVYNAETLEFLEVNDTALDSLGYEAEEMRKLTMFDLAPGLSKEQLEHSQNQLRDGGRDQLMFETVFQKKNGRTFPVEVQLHYRESENPPAFFALVLDISDRLAAREELLLARNEAENANRVKSAFLANMSHELRTPLNAVIGYSELLMEIAEEKNDSDYLADLDRIGSAGLHLLSLIDDVLDLSKIEAGKTELEIREISIANMVNEATTIINPQMEANRNKLEVSLAEDIGAMWSDPVRVRQILFNILSNAAKFTENGWVNITASRVEREAGDEIIFEVSDSGIGISPDRLERLFGEFIQADDSTSRKYGGSGLGLAISRRLCRLMSGDIEAKSEPDEGSTFTVRLPADLRQHSLPADQGEPEPWVDKENLNATEKPSLNPVAQIANDRVSNKILVVEDSDAMGRLIEMYLDDSGFEVELASTVERGLEVLQESRPFLVILDLILPDGSGRVILDKIKQFPNSAATSVIICTSMDQHDSRLIDDSVPHIVKPLNKAQLLSVVADITGGMPSQKLH